MNVRSSAEVEAAATVRESEERFRLATQFPALVLAEVDTDLRYVWIRNPHPDFDEGQVVGKRDDELDPSPEIQQLVEMKREVLETGEPMHRVWSVLRTDGRHYYDFHLKPRVDEQGNQVGVLTAALDQTEQKRAEARLEQELREKGQLLMRLREKDEAIRRAYSDVIEAVTGGKLLLMTPDEIKRALGTPVDSERQVAPGLLTEAIGWLWEYVPREFPSLEPAPVIDAVGEALTNAVKHASGGSYQLYRKDGSVQARVTDHGPGIDFAHLPKATLQPGYSTVGTLGRGFDTMLRNCDSVLLSTQRGNTILVLEFR